MSEGEKTYVSSAHPSIAPSPLRLAGRYEIQASIGSGGMAQVSRARDLSTGQVVGLKWLKPSADTTRAAQATAMLEREFHTLAQLAHPRIVEVYDYGVDPEIGGYYTMELLDGGDVRELSPLPWQEACALAYDACSALAFLHSRRLVHRDITPRNIRRTADGQAKLIDFGLLSAFGPVDLVAGTPPYVAPEVVNLVALDGRSDLFSLGGTLYFALTGRVAYPARQMGQLQDMWRSTPVRPAGLVAGIPDELDTLVMELLRPNVGARPSSAAEVMDRLRPWVPTGSNELQTAQAYLSTPTLVGRDAEVLSFRKHLRRMQRGRGAAIVISGESGVGRSRMLDALLLESKLVGATVARAGALDGSGQRFGVMRTLLRQLAAAAPDAVSELGLRDSKTHHKLFETEPASADSNTDLRHVARDLSDPALERDPLQHALHAWLTGLAAIRPVTLAIDDLSAVDEPSAAVLAVVAPEAARLRLICALTDVPGAVPVAPKAVELLLPHTRPMPLSPLTSESTAHLLKSVFGDVPHIALLAERLHRLTGGNPRGCLGLAQHLVDGGIVAYEGGTWLIPRDLPEGALPTDLSDALARRIRQLPADALSVAQVLAVALPRRLSLPQLQRTDTASEGKSAGEWQRRLRELEMAQVIAGDERGYALSHEEWRRALLDDMDADTTRLRHHRLAAALDEEDNPLPAAHHYLQAGALEAGFARLCPSGRPLVEAGMQLQLHAVALGVEQGAQALVAALDLVDRAGRPRRDQFVLESVLCSLSAIGADAAYYHRVAPSVLRQCKLDSGYDDWLSLADEPDAIQRVFKAFGLAQARFDATPDSERVNPPTDAIRAMTTIVVSSIAIGTRGYDVELLRTLPELLEPFVPLNPLVAAIWGNARATRRVVCHNDLEGARAIWMEVSEQLQAQPADATRDAILSAIDFGIGVLEARMGLPTATAWADKLDLDPHHAVNAEHIRRLSALQRGDRQAADLHRRRAEALMLQENSRQMLAAPQADLTPLVIARDLTGIKQLCQRIDALAAKMPTWRPWQRAARACYLRLRGDLPRALEVLATGLQEVQACQREGHPPVPVWATLRTLEAETRLELGDAEQALRLADDALALCQQYAFPTTDLDRVRAEALGATGETAEALDRLAKMAEAHEARGVRGLMLGALHEGAARVAIAARDLAAFETHAQKAATHYDASQGALLAAKYERLLDEARRAGLIGGATRERRAREGADAALSHLTSTMSAYTTAESRAQHALALLCDAAGARHGHLYLVGEGDLRRVATNAPDTDDDRLSKVLTQFVEGQLDDDIVTQTVSAEASAATTGATDDATNWTTDDDGQKYWTLPLTSWQGDSEAIAGVALLALDRAPDAPELVRLGGHLAEYLVGAGDATWQLTLS